MSDNLGVMLFFWEGLLCTLFGILLINNMHNPRTAVKALTLAGAADLLLMLGIIVTATQAGTLYMSQMTKLPVMGISAVGFVCMMRGARQGGEHAFSAGFNAARRPHALHGRFPGGVGRFLGLPGCALCWTPVKFSGGGASMMMTIGAHHRLAVAMALIQKDMTLFRTPSARWDTWSWVSARLPVGIVGGLFTCLTRVIYKAASL